MLNYRTDVPPLGRYERELLARAYAYGRADREDSDRVDVDVLGFAEYFASRDGGSADLRNVFARYVIESAQDA